MPNTIVRHSYDHLREEEEESSESSSAEVEIFNAHTSDANAGTTDVTSKRHNLETTDGSDGMNPHRSVCLEVFRNTWDEFYEWEKEYCEAKLAALMSERRKGASATATISTTAKKARPTSPPDPTWVIPCPQTTIDLSGILADFDAGPQYESCTPLNGNVYVGDDPDVMPFLPFGEEDWDGYPLPDGGRKRFAYEDYIGEYSELGWMDAFDDPDLDCILYATTNRLAKMSISYAQMDATGVFARTPRMPLLSAPSGDPPGLEARAAKRDFPPFPCLPSPVSPHPSPPPVLSTLRTRIYPLFCHNLTCIRQICPTHPEGTPYPHTTIPEKKSVHLVGNDSSPCSTTCFLLFSKPSGTTLTSSAFSRVVLAPAEHGQRGITGASRPAILDSWSAADRDTLITILELDADARPCDLAVIMKKSCSDIFHFRKRMFPDAMIAPRNPGKAPLKPSRHGTRDNILVLDPQTYTSPGPCYHPGPCDATCPCVLANVQCERKCLCDDFCPLRKGCKCKPQLVAKGNNKDRGVKRVCCRTKRCPCKRAKRACDPEQCVGCAISDSQSPTCCNMAALWAAAGRHRKAVEVRRSAHGYGLFLKESVLADEFLMEYTGEAILDPTCISRDHIIAYRQRNYLFALHTTLGVDSSLAGDPSRFINHGNPPNLVDGSMSVGEGIANVYSHVEIANGGHGVVLYAIDMEAGTELLLDYGPKFFNQISGGDEDGDEEDNDDEEENVEREEAKKYTYWDDDPEYGEAEEYKE
ncbi:SET domain-containing protein [Pleurotus eryngii]|uniref:SET domain-containing protein n=1 Tax=Pleurotus eryngii TaxID=5323 RepID=A0A9P5ZZM8_PLEER|nr:SET domain-containing protein [Pleurotus eryngii]